jgi:hypothetical protein
MLFSPLTLTLSRKGRGKITFDKTKIITNPRNISRLASLSLEGRGVG